MISKLKTASLCLLAIHLGGEQLALAQNLTNDCAVG